jgi:threonylcarbamoyladenosine tRNA methylthiotransferase MtaB
MASFYLLNFGCRASQADGAALKGQLLQAGLEDVPGISNCDVAVLNTCTVTATADAEVRQMVRRIHRTNPRCRILVTGCYAQRAPGEIASLDGVSWVVGNSHKHAIADLLASDFAQVSAGASTGEGSALNPAEAGQLRNPPPGPSPLVQINHTSIAASVGYHSQPQVIVGEIFDTFHFLAAFADDRTRPTLKVQDGCNARCSFCVIPEVRGDSRSLPPGKVIDEVRQLEESGYQEIVLSGINLGSYGRDLDRNINFLALLEAVLAKTSIARLRISSIEPMDVTPALTSLVAREQRLARHFHVPLQSGCDRLLRLMNRRYWTWQYAERLKAIREAIPECGIGADVMTGFPGETAQDHDTSLRFIDTLPLTYVHVFPYSQRPNTAAADMPGQVNGRLSHERAREIRSLVERKRHAFISAQIGRILPALTLHDTADIRRTPHEQAPVVALTTNYLKIVLPQSRVPANTLLNVHICRLHEGTLVGFPDLPAQARQGEQMRRSPGETSLF